MKLIGYSPMPGPSRGRYLRRPELNLLSRQLLLRIVVEELVELNRCLAKMEDAGRDALDTEQILDGVSKCRCMSCFLHSTAV